MSKIKKSELRLIIREVLNEQMGGRMTTVDGTRIYDDQSNKLYKMLGSPKSPDQLLRGYTRVYNQMRGIDKAEELFQSGLPSPKQVATRIDKHAMTGNNMGSAKYGPIVVIGILGLSAAMVGAILYYGGAFDE